MGSSSRRPHLPRRNGSRSAHGAARRRPAPGARAGRPRAPRTRRRPSRGAPRPRSRAPGRRRAPRTAARLQPRWRERRRSLLHEADRLRPGPSLRESALHGESVVAAARRTPERRRAARPSPRSVERDSSYSLMLPASRPRPEPPPGQHLRGTSSAATLTEADQASHVHRAPGDVRVVEEGGAVKVVLVQLLHRILVDPQTPVRNISSSRLALCDFACTTPCAMSSSCV